MTQNLILWLLAFISPIYHLLRPKNTGIYIIEKICSLPHLESMQTMRQKLRIINLESLETILISPLLQPLTSRETMFI